jgi:hypothetical protein
MENVDDGLSALADYLRARREDILQAWRNAIKKDPALTTSDSLPRIDLYDHIPALLSTFEQQLRSTGTLAPAADDDAGHAPAAAHGLQRWQQGYDLKEVTRELGKLNEIVVAELEIRQLRDVAHFVAGDRHGSGSAAGAASGVPVGPVSIPEASCDSLRPPCVACPRDQ